MKPDRGVEMRRKLRMEYAAAVCHVLNRGDRREAIFQTDRDRVLFIDTLAEVCEKTGWQAHALCQWLKMGSAGALANLL